MSLVIATSSGLSSLEFSTGNIIKTYKGSENVTNGIDLLRSETDHLPSSIITVQKDKPLIHHYSLRKETAVKRIVLPSKVESISASPNGKWLVAGSNSGALYLWNLWSGSLQAFVTEAHFQTVKTISWSRDSSVLVTGGADSRILIWSVFDLISGQTVTPRHILTQHSLPITSCFVGYGGFREARLYAASLDATVSVSDLYSGRLLYTLICDSPANALVVDPAERAVYIGCNNGVHSVPLYFEPSDSSKIVAAGSQNGSVVSTTDIERRFKTESKVTALTLSTDGSHLIVGCDDGSVASWEVGSGQLVKKYRSTKGHVSNIIYFDESIAETTALETLPMLQRNPIENSTVMEFVPRGTTHISSEDLSGFDSDELDKIDLLSQSQTSAVNETSEDSELAARYKSLEERHEQLKKSYDALWARHSKK